jgi:mitogen-activated protein kinase 1/3
MKPEKAKEVKATIPKGRAVYEVGGTQFVIDDKYEIVKQVGSGAYGVVASALNKQTNKKVAIKKVT